MGLFNKKNKITDDIEATPKPKRGPTWRYTEGNNAIKIIDQEIMETGEIIIPKILIKYFDIDTLHVGEQGKLNLRFLNGNYICKMERPERSEGLIVLEPDLCETIKGMCNSYIRETGIGAFYIQFIKTAKQNHAIKIGVASRKRDSSK